MQRADPIATVGGIRVMRTSGESAFFFASGLTVDADGSPKAYHPRGSPPGLDHLANAGGPGHWWALVTDVSGKPVVQGADDPAPGFYVSMTALSDATKPARDPRRYVNASRVPYIVLPPEAKRWGARLGDIGAVWNRETEKLAFAIFDDVGPATKIGEGSVALARRLGVPASPKSGGQGSGIAYVVFTGSGNGKPRGVPEVVRLGNGLLDEWGGVERLARAAKRSNP
jgi:hypothetical protein